MGTIFLQQFVREIIEFNSVADYGTIAKRLLPVVKPQVKLALTQAEEDRLLVYCNSKLANPWNTVFFHNIKARVHLDNGLVLEAFEAQECALVYLNNAKRAQLPVLFGLIKDLKLLAILADNLSKKKDNKSVFLERSTQTITRAFSTCLNDRQAQANSFVLGVYGIANALFSIYLRLRSLHLYKSILRSLDAADLPPIENYPVSQQITFRYYLGRYEFFNEDFFKAKAHLNAAFKMCPDYCFPQRRQILTYLLPIMLHIGRLPKPKLLDQFPCLSAIYRPIVCAIRQGHLSGLDKAIEASESYFLGKGVFITVEKSKDFAARELIRNTNKLVGADARLSMDHIHRAFRISSAQDLEYDQVECIVSVLIYKRHVMGYISHERRTLVLSKVDPFPTIG